MNKLASINYLDSLGLPTINPRIIYLGDERGVENIVNRFYYERKGGWVLRCAELPDMHGKLERGLPWALAYSKPELITKIFEMQKEVGDRYYVFCHEQSDMVHGGVMLVDGGEVIIEAAEGGPVELSAMFRGKRNPEQSILFKPGMMSFKDSGKSVLTLEDLEDLRKTERSMIWADIPKALDNPVAIEFSRLRMGGFYVHDISVAA